MSHSRTVFGEISLPPIQHLFYPQKDLEVTHLFGEISSITIQHKITTNS